MTRYKPIQERERTFEVVASLRGSAKIGICFNVMAHNATEALKKASIPENMPRVRSELGDGELVWAVLEDFI